MVEKHRISKVTTRAGDTGNTKLATGRTIGKHELIVSAMGAIDELNSHIGLLRAYVGEAHQETLAEVQQALFDLGAVFAMEGSYGAPSPDHIETVTEALNESLPPLTEFVLPGGGQAAAQSHVCRATCRRAETTVWQLNYEIATTPDAYLGAARYLNRLSDYLFVLARALTATAETQWQGPSQA